MIDQLVRQLASGPLAPKQCRQLRNMTLQMRETPEDPMFQFDASNLERLLIIFADEGRDRISRRWIGVFLVELFKNYEMFREMVQTISTRAKQAIGEIILTQSPDEIKIAAALMIQAIQGPRLPLTAFWIDEIASLAQATFCVDNDTQFVQDFDALLDQLSEIGKFDGSQTLVFWAIACFADDQRIDNIPGSGGQVLVEMDENHVHLIVLPLARGPKFIDVLFTSIRRASFQRYSPSPQIILGRVQLDIALEEGTVLDNAEPLSAKTIIIDIRDEGEAKEFLEILHLRCNTGHDGLKTTPLPKSSTSTLTSLPKDLNASQDSRTIFATTNISSPRAPNESTDPSHHPKIHDNLLDEHGQSPMRANDSSTSGSPKKRKQRKSQVKSQGESQSEGYDKSQARSQGNSQSKPQSTPQDTRLKKSQDNSQSQFQSQSRSQPQSKSQSQSQSQPQSKSQNRSQSASKSKTRNTVQMAEVPKESTSKARSSAAHSDPANSTLKKPSRHSDEQEEIHTQSHESGEYDEAQSINIFEFPEDKGSGQEGDEEDDDDTSSKYRGRTKRAKRLAVGTGKAPTKKEPASRKPNNPASRISNKVKTPNTASKTSRTQEKHSQSSERRMTRASAAIDLAASASPLVRQVEADDYKDVSEHEIVSSRELSESGEITEERNALQTCLKNNVVVEQANLVENSPHPSSGTPHARIHIGERPSKVEPHQSTAIEDLIHDDLIRKPKVVHFATNGPMNQGSTPLPAARSLLEDAAFENGRTRENISTDADDQSSNLNGSTAHEQELFYDVHDVHDVIEPLHREAGSTPNRSSDHVTKQPSIDLAVFMQPDQDSVSIDLTDVVHDQEGSQSIVDQDPTNAKGFLEESDHDLKELSACSPSNASARATSKTMAPNNLPRQAVVVQSATQDPRLANSEASPIPAPKNSSHMISRRRSATGVQCFKAQGDQEAAPETAALLQNGPGGADNMIISRRLQAPQMSIVQSPEGPMLHTSVAQNEEQSPAHPIQKRSRSEMAPSSPHPKRFRAVSNNDHTVVEQEIHNHKPESQIELEPKWSPLSSRVDGQGSPHPVDMALHALDAVNPSRSRHIEDHAEAPPTTKSAQRSRKTTVQVSSQPDIDCSFIQPALSSTTHPQQPMTKIGDDVSTASNDPAATGAEVAAITAPRFHRSQILSVKVVKLDPAKGETDAQPRKASTSPLEGTSFMDHLQARAMPAETLGTELARTGLARRISWDNADETLVEVEPEPSKVIEQQLRLLPIEVIQDVIDSSDTELDSSPSVSAKHAGIQNDGSSNYKQGSGMYWLDSLLPHQQHFADMVFAVSKRLLDYVINTESSTTTLVKSYKSNSRQLIATIRKCHEEEHNKQMRKDEVALEHRNTQLRGTVVELEKSWKEVDVTAEQLKKNEEDSYVDVLKLAKGLKRLLKDHPEGSCALKNT